MSRKKKTHKAGKQRWWRPRRGHRRAALLWLIAVFFAGSLYFLYDLPGIEDVKPFSPKPGITVLANDGAVIARYGGRQGAVLRLHQIPPHVVAAVLSVEDRRFFRHYGIDPWGLGRAMLVNLRAGRWVQGGSTITQQLAKNIFLTADKTLRRKVQEALLALRIESRFTKNDILTAYLNRVYFGAGAYGIDAAAKTYFNKPGTALTLWEGAVLAGLLKAPSRFSPAANPELAQKRADVVIGAMRDAGYIDAATARQVVQNSEVTAPPALSGNQNRYFADWVIDQIDSFITTTQSDLVVRTTLDPKLQALAEARSREVFAAIPRKDKVSQMALLTEAPDGAVLAMIGGVNYKESQFNRVTQAKRQPGSAFKPFVYLAALESGLNPNNLIEDGPIKDGIYRPDNYNDEYFGTVTLTDALSKSMNTATTRLLQLVGLDRLLDVASRMGFTGDLRPEPSLGLGTAEVTLIELVNAYAVIANGGRAAWPYAVLSIKDGSGQLLYQKEDADEPRLFADGDIAALDGMLEQVMAQGTGKSAQLPHGHTAGKTGTTQNYRDAWFVGYTDRLVTGIWMGNDDNTPMHDVTGGKHPAKLWRDYMIDAVKVDVPEFVPEQVYGEEGGFSGMLGRWSSGAPVYNK